MGGHDGPEYADSLPENTGQRDRIYLCLDQFLICCPFFREIPLNRIENEEISEGPCLKTGQPQLPLDHLSRQPGYGYHQVSLTTFQREKRQEGTMGKNIILLSDGTGNSTAKRHKTNAWRLYEALDLHRDDQVAVYDDGVGSQDFLPLKILGGSIGLGLMRNVRELYKHLCRIYEEGDRIYLFGFSRGAFTVRVLAAMINHCGLCRHDGTPGDLDRKARENYFAYRLRYQKGGLLTRLLRRLLRSKELLKASTEPKQDASTEPKIEFIGVWDTVDAYGLPIDELAILWDKFIYALYFPDRSLSINVRKACHAVSVDDARLTFHPLLWDEGEEARQVAEGKVAAGRIEQVWFPGMHSDVSGGYPESSLALLSLDWMISKVEADATRPDSPGLHLIPARREEIRRRADWHGIQHDSRAGLAAYYRYKPRDIARLCDDAENGVHIDRPKLHRSVLERVRKSIVPYAPTGLPATYSVVATRGETPTYETAEEAAKRAEAMNAALDIIFWRHWLYGGLLATTLFLLLAPLLLPWERDGICLGKACLLDPPLRWVQAVLPDFAGAWFAVLSQHPAWLWGMLAAYAILFSLRQHAHRKTVRHATAAWAALKLGRAAPTWLEGFTARFRAAANNRLRRFAKWSLVGIVLLLILILLVIALDRVALHARSTLGSLCDGSASAILRAPTGAVIKFPDIASPCFATGLRLEKGKRYRIEIAKPNPPWRDGSFQEIGPEGFDARRISSMTLAIPLRRHIRQPWLKLMGRINAAGTEEFAIGAGLDEYAPRSDGELFLYVNDAVFGLLPGDYWAWPYFWSIGRNQGGAQITVTVLSTP
jgi:uncharacterized protein (DUF2235 family)